MNPDEKEKVIDEITLSLVKANANYQEAKEILETVSERLQKFVHSIRIQANGATENELHEFAKAIKHL